jgi:hypothetical protein
VTKPNNKDNKDTKNSDKKTDSKTEEKLEYIHILTSSNFFAVVVRDILLVSSAFVVSVFSMISIFTSFFFFEELDFHPLGVSRLTLRPVRY